MFTRRIFCKTMSLLPLASLFRSASVESQSAASVLKSSACKDPTQFVKIAIGTGGHGHTYPGATVPFGMVQLSPDTRHEGWDGCSGYHHSDNSIMGFSHTHLSGTGVGDMLDVLVMPGVEPQRRGSGSAENLQKDYRSRFSHADETAEPGYYSVLLKDYGIRAELSATERAGIHKYTFPRNDASYFLVDLAHKWGDAPILWSKLRIVNNDTIVGGRSIGGWASGREIYFAMKFSKPFVALEVFSDGENLSSEMREAKGKSLKCLIHYQTIEQEAVCVKTGISGVSVEGALKNVETEMPHWDFDGIRQAAREKWRRELSA